MSKISKVIIIIMSFIILCLLTSNIILIIKINNKTIESPINNDIQRAIGIYHSQDYRNYRDSTLKLNDDMTCEYPNENVDCTWSISNDEISITKTKYLITDDTKYTDEYYYKNNGTKEYKKLSIGTSKVTCEEQIKREQDELKNARCEKGYTNNEILTLVNGGVLINNHIFNKIK